MEEYAAYLRKQRTHNTPTHIEQADCIDLLKIRQPNGFRANLIFFSPPYCNAIEYWRRHRLEYLLGHFLDERGIIDLSRKFIGRTTVGGVAIEPPALGYPPIDGLIRALQKKQRIHKARVLWQYFDSMRRRLEIFREYLPRRGHCVIVVGDSETGGQKVPTVRTISRLAENAGFRHVTTARYKIKNRVMQFPVKSNSKIENESIIVLRKP